MSLSEEFQITLASNVKSNARNKPHDFETTLAKPLDLPGDWEVALIDLSYPYRWTNLDKPLYVAILTNPTEDINDLVLDTFTRPEDQDLYRALTSQQGLPRMWVRRLFRMPPGNYTVQDIADVILNHVGNYLKDIKNPKITINENTLKVKFEQDSKYAIATYTDNSVLKILGLSKQTKTIVTPGKPEVEYIILETDHSVTSELTPKLKRLTNMFVYSDIVELSLVGDTQAALLGYLPIQSKFGDQAYWSFNPPYYVRLREKLINTITIQLCYDTGGSFSIEEGKIFCRLNFRRVGLLH